jgi:hypothetical protein
MDKHHFKFDLFLIILFIATLALLPLFVEL